MNSLWPLKYTKSKFWNGTKVEEYFQSHDQNVFAYLRQKMHDVIVKFDMMSLYLWFIIAVIFFRFTYTACLKKRSLRFSIFRFFDQQFHRIRFFSFHFSINFSILLLSNFLIFQICGILIFRVFSFFVFRFFNFSFFWFFDVSIFWFAILSIFDFSSFHF